MVLCRKANAIHTNYVDNDVVFAFHSKMGPSSHTAGIVGGLVAATCPAS